MTRLEIIRRVIEEHHKVRSAVKLVGDSVNDLEAIFSLQKAHAAWAQTSTDSFTQNVERLLQAVNALNEGLSTHFGYEEKYLPPLLGELLMEALVLEHGEIRKKLTDCGTFAAENLRGTPQERLLANRSALLQLTGDLSQTVEAHASREEVILKMAHRVLEAEEKDKTR